MKKDVIVKGCESLMTLETSEKDSGEKKNSLGGRKLTLPHLDKSQMKSSVKFALKLVLFDFLWSIFTALICLAVSVALQQVPTSYFCSLLKEQLNGTGAHNIPRFSIIMEIVSYNLLHLMPTFTCIWLMDDIKAKSWLNYLSLVFTRWNKLFKILFLVVGLDIMYRLIIFVVYTLNDLAYPLWFSYPLNFLWICGLLATTWITSNIWIAKQSANFVLGFRLTQSKVQKESKKAKSSIIRKIVMSLITPALLAILFQTLFEFFQVSKERDRQLMIIIAMLTAYPMWMWIDREGRSSLPWSIPIRDTMKAFSTNYLNTLQNHNLPHADNNLTACSLNPVDENFNGIQKYKDCIEKNGFILSALIMTGTIISVRILQANMEVLSSKITSGLMTSVMESVFILLEPRITIMVDKLVKEFHKLFKLKVDIVDQVQVERMNEEKEIKKKIFVWHRSHIVIMMNRLNMFSIMISNSLVLLGSTARMRAYESSGLSAGGHSNCEDISSISDSLIGIFVLIVLEIVISIVSYTYIDHVENLPLIQVYKEKKVSNTLTFYVVMVLFFNANQYFTLVYNAISCGDQLMYEFHCT